MACQKTVVDFTLMSDAEIINYFSKATGTVCGRLAADQLNRKLEVPRPPRRSPWVGWPVLLSGLLFTTDEPASNRAIGKAVIHQCEQPKADGRDNATTGGIIMPLLVNDMVEDVTMGTPVVMQPDTGVVLQLEPGTEEMGVIAIGPPEDSVGTITDTVQLDKPYKDTDRLFTGGILTEVVSHDPVDSFGLDQPATTMIGSLFDTLKRIVSDSLTAVGIKTSDSADRTAIKYEPGELTIYPNPVLKGSSLNLSWKKEADESRMMLYNTNGVLVQSWMIEGGSTIKTLTIPGNIAAGGYVLQVLTKHGGYSKKLIVE